MLQRVRYVLAALAFFTFLTSQAIAQTGSALSQHPKKIVVVKNTPIVVQTYNAVNSATFHSGEHMAYLVSDDVIVNGAIVAKSGDPASGTVEDAQQGRKVHAGTIGIVAGPAGMAAGSVANKAAGKGADLRFRDEFANILRRDDSALFRTLRVSQAAAFP